MKPKIEILLNGVEYKTHNSSTAVSKYIDTDNIQIQLASILSPEVINELQNGIQYKTCDSFVLKGKVGVTTLRVSKKRLEELFIAIGSYLQDYERDIN